MSNAVIVAPATPAINTPTADPVLTAVTAEMPPLDRPTTYDEVHSLALELCEHEGYSLGEALSIAADDLDYYLAYIAPRWDRHAFHAGNDAALPF